MGRTTAATAGIAALVVALAGAPAHAAGAPSPGAGPALSEELAAADVVWLNDQRAQAGLPTLQVVAWARGLAEQHSQDMAARRGIFHNTAPLVAAAEDAGGVSRYGENVGLGGDLGITQWALLNSPPHRENILDGRFNQMGVGVATDAWGLIYVTEDFAEVAMPPGAGSQTPSPGPPSRFASAPPAEVSPVDPRAGAPGAAPDAAVLAPSRVPGPARTADPAPATPPAPPTAATPPTPPTAATAATAPTAPGTGVPPRAGPPSVPPTEAPQMVLSVAGMPELGEPLPAVQPAAIAGDAGMPRAARARVPVVPPRPEEGAVELALLTVALLMVSRRSRPRPGRHSFRA